MSTQTKIAVEMARKAAEEGDRARARELLREAAARDPSSEEVYLLFAQVAQKREHAIYCLQRVLEINPDNDFAHRALEKMQSRATETASAAPRRRRPPKPALEKKAPKPKARRPGLRLTLVAAVFIVFAMIGGGAWYANNRANGDRASGASVTTPQPTEADLTPTARSGISAVEDTRLETVDVGRVLVRVGNPASFENVWQLITIEEYDRTAFRIEEESLNWWGFDITIATEFEYPHPVKFRARIENPATEDLVYVLSEEIIQPPAESEEDTEKLETTTIPLTFFQFVPSEDPDTTIEVVEVEILRIDDMTEDEWTKPDVSDQFYRDIWLISNPTSEWLPLAWEMEKRRPDGEVIGRRESKLCMNSTGDFFEFFKTMTFLPPGEQIVVTEDLTSGEALSGVETELMVEPLEECALAQRLGIEPDQDIELMQLTQSDESIQLVFDNGSGKGAFAILYLNVYDEQGMPVAGRVLQLHQSSVTVAPDEQGEFDVTIEPLQWLEPIPARVEVVFLGLSR
jgi:hypothetical protein